MPVARLSPRCVSSDRGDAPGSEREIVAQEGTAQPMRVNHRFIYAGVFLVALGGILVATDLGAIPNDTLVQVLRLWPVAVIAIGLGLVLRRTRIGLGTGMLAAAMPGLLLGGAFAAAPRLAGNCGSEATSGPVYTDGGSFSHVPVAVFVTTGCGSLHLGIDQSLDSWSLTADRTSGAQPRVDATTESLSIGPGGPDDWHILGNGRDTWQLALPWQAIYSTLNVEANANRADLDLTNGQLQHLDITGNAALVRVDATGAVIGDINARIKVGELRLQLPATSDVTANIRIAGGRTLICAPPGVGLRLTFTGQLRDVSIGDLKETATNWESAGYETAIYHANVSVRADVGGIEINPTGGCA